MIIRKKQAAYLGMTQFIRRFRDLLWENYPDSKKIARETLDGFIQQQLEKAHAYGLRTEHAIGMYVLVAWQLGDGFDERFPVIKERLSRTDWDNEIKAYWLQTFTLDFLQRLEQGDGGGPGNGLV